MGKKTTLYCCSNEECEYEKSMKFGLCPECKTGFGTAKEEEQTNIQKIVMNDKKDKKNNDALNKTYVKKEITKAKDIDKNDLNVVKRIQSGMNAFDELLGGSEGNYGIFPESLVLIGGRPGIGKSTILTQVIEYIQENQTKSDGSRYKCAYISAEESKTQIVNRADRLKCKKNWEIDCENNIYQIMTDFADADFLIIDSINMMYIEGRGQVGHVSQIKECTITLMNWAKHFNKTIFLIGQVNGEGDIAGPQVLEHMVDTVIFFDNYDKNAIYRMMRSFKNRNGEANEIRIFEMTGLGLKEISNPSLIFINEDEEKIGASLSIITEGKIPIFVETQSLLATTSADKTLTQSIGYDTKRIYQLTAIMQKHLKENTFKKNIFVSLTGGIKVKQTYLDLAVVAAMISSLKEVSFPNYVFIGELGLTGEIIKAPYESELIKQSKKYGFEKVISNTTGYKHISEVFEKLLD